MKVVAALVAIAAALALQTTLASLVIRGTAALDLVLIVVVYVSLVSGPVRGLLLGTAAGLIQDALSSGIIGVGGLAKTVVGFVTEIRCRSEPAWVVRTLYIHWRPVKSVTDSIRFPRIEKVR